MNTVNTYKNQMDKALRSSLAENYFAERGIELKFAKNENRVCKSITDEWILFLKYANEIDKQLKKFRNEVKHDDGTKTVSMYDLCHEWNMVFFIDESGNAKFRKALDKLSKYLTFFDSVPEEAPEIMREYLWRLGEDEVNIIDVGNKSTQTLGLLPLYLHTTEGEDDDPDHAVCPEFPQSLKTYAMFKRVEFYFLSGFTHIAPATPQSLYAISDIVFKRNPNRSDKFETNKKKPTKVCIHYPK